MSAPVSFPSHCETSHILSRIAASEKPESNAIFKNFVTPILKKIRAQVDQYRSSGGTRPAIAIAGYSGIGKSYFVCQLFNLLHQEGIQTSILRFDDFIDPKLSKLDEEEVTSVLEIFDSREAHSFLKKMSLGETLIEKPYWYQGETSYKAKENFNLEGTELLIFDGELSFCDREPFNFFAYSTLRIILDAANKDDIIRWDWERNRNRTTISYDKFADVRNKRINSTQPIFERLKSKADFVILKYSDHSLQFISGDI